MCDIKSSDALKQKAGEKLVFSTKSPKCGKQDVVNVFVNLDPGDLPMHFV